MKRILNTSLFFILFVFSFLQAEIYEIAHFEEIYKHLQPDTLIVYDIDDTLIVMNQELGSDHWFYHRFQRHQREGLTNQDALEKALNEWESVQHLSGCKPVEPINPEVVAYTQKHFTVIGLTTRGLGLATRTCQLLQESGYDLSLNPLTQEELHFMQQNEGILFRKGVLFTAGKHKGECLEKLLKATGTTPKRVLFINDKRSHLLPVEEFCVRAGIPFTGLRYGFVDERRNTFNPEISDIQWAHFGNILSDEEAEMILQGSCIERTSP
jgi:hypothetical protein